MTCRCFMVHHMQSVERLRGQTETVNKGTFSFKIFWFDVKSWSWSYFSHEDESSAEHHKQSVLIILQQNSKGTARKRRQEQDLEKKTLVISFFRWECVCLCVCWPDESGPAWATIQAAQVATDGCLLKLFDVFHLFLSGVSSLCDKQLHQVEQLLHRLQGTVHTHVHTHKHMQNVT